MNAQTKPAACDRACLEGCGQYLDAAIAHNPALLPLSKDIKFTENGVRLALPDGHWKIMTAKANTGCSSPTRMPGRSHLLERYWKRETPKKAQPPYCTAAESENGRLPKLKHL